ncbi:hypothetical protein Ancab_019751 [Ancistrocladus abbreviatus]
MQAVSRGLAHKSFKPSPSISSLKSIYPISDHTHYAVDHPRYGSTIASRGTGTIVRKGTGGRSSVSGLIATVFGATGFLGRYLVQQLAKMGSQVLVPFRGSEDSPRHLKLMGDLGQIVPMKYNPRDEDSIKAAMAKANVVINLIGREYETRNYSFEEVNHHMAEQLALGSRAVNGNKAVRPDGLAIAFLECYYGTVDLVEVYGLDLVVHLYGSVPQFLSSLVVSRKISSVPSKFLLVDNLESVFSFVMEVLSSSYIEWCMDALRKFFLLGLTAKESHCKESFFLFGHWRGWIYNMMILVKGMIAKEHGGIMRFIQVSCLGASPTSPSRMLKAKAAAEEAILRELPEDLPAASSLFAQLGVLNLIFPAVTLYLLGVQVLVSCGTHVHLYLPLLLPVSWLGSSLLPVLHYFAGVVQPLNVSHLEVVLWEENDIDVIEKVPYSKVLSFVTIIFTGSSETTSIQDRDSRLHPSVEYYQPGLGIPPG